MDRLVMNATSEHSVLTLINEYAMQKNREFCYEALKKVDMKLSEEDFEGCVTLYIKSKWFMLCAVN